jgi:hypothetical protein
MYGDKIQNLKLLGRELKTPFYIVTRRLKAAICPFAGELR